MTSPCETLVQSIPNPEIIAECQGRIHQTLQQLGRVAARVVLSVSLAVGGGVVAGTAAEMAEPSPSAAAAADFVNDYPHMDAQLHSQPNLEWWVDENGDGKKYIKVGANDELMSPRGFDYRNCTDGAAYWAKKYTDVSIPGTWGNAIGWDTAASNAGYTVKGGNSNDIEIGDIAQSDDGTWGHVGYVTEVTKNGDGRVTTVRIAELNKSSDGNFSNDEYRIKNAAGNFVRSSTRDWDHFIDLNGSQPPAQSPGTNANVRLMGDVNGDGKDDAVVMFAAVGAAKVALSTGSSFGYPGDWSWGHSVSANAYLLGDVNGDGKDDLVAYYADTRKWYTSLSSGSGFWAPTEWSYDEPNFANPDRLFLADATGDGKADKMMFFNASGNWFVSPSSGNGFWPLQGWIGGHGANSSDQLVADFNGDGKADAGIYFASNGNWHVGLSHGSQFGYPGQWSAGHGLGTQFRIAGDATGDGKADIGYYSSNIYKWWVGPSAGSGFWAPTEWSYDGSGYNSMDNAFLARFYK